MVMIIVLVMLFVMSPRQGSCVSPTPENHVPRDKREHTDATSNEEVFLLIVRQRHAQPTFFKARGRNVMTPGPPLPLIRFVKIHGPWMSVTT